MLETLTVIVDRYEHLFITPPPDWTAHDFLAVALLMSVFLAVVTFAIYEVRALRSARKAKARSTQIDVGEGENSQEDR